MTDTPQGDGPPTILNPEEAAEAEEILKRKPNVPRGHTDLADSKPAHQETISPAPKCLDDQHVWFFPALAYCMVGLDRSVFELFSHEVGKPIDIVTYRTDKPVALFDGGDVSKNAWFHTVQGISPDLSGRFSEYIQTFMFNDAPNNLSWRLVLHELRVADPFVDGERVGVNMVIFLPECLTSRKRVAVMQEPGLMLSHLILGVQEVPTQDTI